MPKILNNEDDIDLLEFTEKKCAKSNHYLDNTEVYNSLMDWKAQIKICKLQNKPRPQIPDIVSKAIMDVSNNLAYRYNFIDYTYRDEMIGDGIHSCVRYIHNYDPSKGTPHSYMTKIAEQSFVRRINKEKREYYYKLKTVQMNQGFAAEALEELVPGGDTEPLQSDLYNDIVSQVSEYERKHKEKYEEMKAKTKIKDDKSNKTVNLEEFLIDDEDGCDGQ